MSTLDLARSQFAVTTLFHFIFVPMSIGLAAFVALCETLHYRTERDVYLRMTRFWGKFLLISMAVGVVTGIIQEFQFGMNWSQYSRYVGDIFGAPLAMEGLIAFFLESTFIGLWIFGWGRMSARVHLLTAWCVAVGTMISAYFILAANSWMQHPVGYVFNRVSHRAELTSIWKVLTNSTVLLAFPHTAFGALTTAGVLIIGICAFQLLRGRGSDVVTRSLRLALPITLATAIVTLGFGHFQGQLMERQQPMKMAAAEVLYNTTTSASFSIFAYGPFQSHPAKLTKDIRIPDVLSLLSTNTLHGKVDGIRQIQAAEVKKYGPGNYIPNLAVTYWTFRLMIGAGILMFLLALSGLILQRRGRLARSRWFQRACIIGIGLPILANWTGWMFTEMGRQPWVVYGLLKTSNAGSPDVSQFDVILTLAGFIAVLLTVTCLGAWLMIREAKHGPDDGSPPPPGTGDPSLPLPSAHPELVMAY